jgi:hypothetical protein
MLPASTRIANAMIMKMNKSFAIYAGSLIVVAMNAA